MSVMRVCRVWPKKGEEYEEDQLVSRGVPQKVKVGASDN